MPLKPAYTTGEAARICHLNQTTIIRLFDAGVLKGYYVPESRARRIPHDELVKFLVDHALPNPFSRIAEAAELSRRIKPVLRNANYLVSRRI